MDWYFANPLGPSYIGLEGFKNLIYDPIFHYSLITTLIYTFGVTLLELIIGLSLALLATQEFRGRRLFRTLLILPIAITPVAVGLTWKVLLNTDGIVNFLLKIIGLKPISWFAYPTTALYSLMLVDAWQWSPFIALSIIAAFEALPIPPIEAAIIDGASYWQQIRYIKLPLIKDVLTIALMFRLCDAFKTFDIIFAITGGGPANATQTLAIYTYYNAFYWLLMGNAGRLCTFIFYFSFVIVYILARRIKVE
jgi:multiple sugar transport system permease protein